MTVPFKGPAGPILIRCAPKGQRFVCLMRKHDLEESNRFLAVANCRLCPCTRLSFQCIMDGVAANAKANVTPRPHTELSHVILLAYGASTKTQAELCRKKPTNDLCGGIAPENRTLYESLLRRIPGKISCHRQNGNGHVDLVHLPNDVPKMWSKQELQSARGKAEVLMVPPWDAAATSATITLCSSGSSGGSRVASAFLAGASRILVAFTSA